MFLAKYKMMLASNCKMIYNTKDYHRKRLKVLENNRYIRRIKRIYIKLDVKGTKLVKEFGYDYSFNCRKSEYIVRLEKIARIASLTINSDIEFTASWNLKDDEIFTETSRKYIGELKIFDEKWIVYYLSSKQVSYIGQITNDIRKLINYNNIIIFINNYKVLEKINKFSFGKEALLFIEETPENFEILKILNKINIYDLIISIYTGLEILISNLKVADYMIEDEKYIIFMPFIDIERINNLNLFLKSKSSFEIKIDIITLEKNQSYLKNIIISEINIVILDKWVGGLNYEEMEF